MQLTRASILAVSLCLTGLGCAQKQIQKEVDQAVAMEEPRTTPQELGAKALETINTSESLTESQKARLRALEARVAADNAKMREENSKLKVVLFETITTAPYDFAKVDVIKKRLEVLNKKYMSVMFKAIDESEEIIGYKALREKKDMLRTIIFDSEAGRTRE